MSFEYKSDADRELALPVRVGDRELSILPLSMRQIIKLASVKKRMTLVDATSITDDDLSVMMEALHIGCQRGYPDLTKDELLDAPMSIIELLLAVDVVMRQAGGQKSAGESKATSDTKSSTGTVSSPTS